MPDEESKARLRVLVAEDNPLSQVLARAILSREGHSVTLVENGKEAVSAFAAQPFDVVLLDLQMPLMDGWEAMQEIRKLQASMPVRVPVIALTAEEGRPLPRSESSFDAVGNTLRGGAVDFIEKPVFLEDLEGALSKAIDSTQRRRSAAATQSGVRDAGRLQRRLNHLYSADQLPTAVTICFHPKFDAGGDSVAFFPLDSGRMLVVTADVSGHDLKSALLSAYFQGLLRGMVGQRVAISEILEHFNSFLVKDWLESPGDSVASASSEVTSLAVCSALVDLEAGRVSISSSGFPLPARIDREGIPRVCDAVSGYPLGWFDPNPVSSISVAAREGDHLVVWTDGLEDFANKLRVSPWSLAYRILGTEESSRTPDWLAEAQDDILLVHIALSKQDKAPAQFPLLSETYEKPQLENIDALQGDWQRSIQFALPNLPPGSLFDVLLCMREAVINGLLHGCRAEGDVCRISVVADREKQRLRVDVADPGPGHEFNLARHSEEASDQLLDEHRGLLLIHGFAEGVEREKNGAKLRIFFNLEANLNNQCILS